MPRKKQQPSYPAWLVDSPVYPEFVSLDVFGSFAAELYRILQVKPDSALDTIRDDIDGNDVYKTIHALGVGGLINFITDRTDQKRITLVCKFVKGMIALTKCVHRIQERAAEDAQFGLVPDDKELGSGVQLAFTDFFMQASEELGQDEVRVVDLYNEIFKQNSSLMRVAFDDRIPQGILSAIRGYVYLKTHEYADAVFSVPNVIEDTRHAVDLVCEREERGDGDGKIKAKYLFQIKGVQGAKRVKLYDLSKQDDLNELYALIDKKVSAKLQKDYKDALNRLIAYQKEIDGKDGYRIRAFWVEVIMEE